MVDYSLFPRAAIKNRTGIGWAISNSISRAEFLFTLVLVEDMQSALLPGQGSIEHRLLFLTIKWSLREQIASCVPLESVTLVTCLLVQNNSDRCLSQIKIRSCRLTLIFNRAELKNCSCNTQDTSNPFKTCWLQTIKHKHTTGRASWFLRKIMGRIPILCVLHKEKETSDINSTFVSCYCNLIKPVFLMTMVTYLLVVCKRIKRGRAIFCAAF